MSGCSYDTNCPNCENSIDAYSDYKPFDHVSLGPCPHCGFHAYTKVEYITDLDELNSIRSDFNEMNELEGEDLLHPLTELPPQDMSL
jgi:hypothetical protein